MLPIVAGAAPPLAMVIVPSAQICAFGCATGVLEPFLVAVTVHLMSPGDWTVETSAVLVTVQLFSDVLQYESVAPDRLILACCANAGTAATSEEAASAQLSFFKVRKPGAFMTRLLVVVAFIASSFVSAFCFILIMCIFPTGIRRSLPRCRSSPRPFLF